MAKLKFDPNKNLGDPREMPAYGIPLAAHYVCVPETTLRSWVIGRDYKTESGTKRAQPVILLPDPERPLLSFFNLAEAHVLRALRKEHAIKLPHIRAALEYVCDRFGKVHPLVQATFQTDGVRLFVEELGKLIDASGFGQAVMPEIMGHLERLEFENEVVARIYPFTRPHDAGPKTVFIDPRYSFGRPVLVGINVPTSAIVERYKAGETVDNLAHDYGCERLAIEEAIRSELAMEQAA